MASFSTILSDIGNGLKKIFGIGVAASVAAEPIVDILFPGIAPLYNGTVSAVAAAESAAIAAGNQSGSGPQKLAAVVTAITPIFVQYAQSNGLATPSQAVIENYVNAVVATLNAIPAVQTAVKA